MHHVKLVPLNIRLVALLAVTVAVLLAASSLAPPRQASAEHDAYDLDLIPGSTLFCIDIFFDTAPLIANPETHEGGSDNSDFRAAKIMVRFDSLTTTPDTWLVTSEALNITDFPPTADLTTAACGDPDKGDNNPAPPPSESGDNPTLTPPVATFDKVTDEVVWTTECELFDLGPGLYVLTEFTIFVNGAGNTDNGRNRARVGTDPDVCNDIGGDLIYSAMEVQNRTATKITPNDTPGVNDNWDGDGCTDWDELDPKGARGSNSVFIADCPGVGGIAELADEAGTPLAATDSSGSNTGLIAGIVAAIAAGVVSLGGAAWYTRRRSIQ